MSLAIAGSDAVTTCSVEACGKPVRSRGLCGMHYKRWQRYGDTETVLQGGPTRMESRTCTVVDCERPALARGLCSTHWHRWRKHGDPLHGGPIRAIGRGTCTVEGCGEPHLARGYCRNHYATWQRHGTPTGEVAAEGRDERWLKQRASILKRNYRLTTQQYDAMAKAQHGRCKLCGNTPTTKRFSRSGKAWVVLMVDHDHRCCPGSRSCGKCVRGLVCPSCNRGMALADRVGVEAIAAYQGQLVDVAL